MLKRIRDFVLDAAGITIGLLEMIGLKYPVRKYRFEVSKTLTRGSRLDAKTIGELRQDGFKLIVNLCAENDADAKPSAYYGIRAVHIPIIDNSPPKFEQMVQFVKLVSDQKNQPAYVHCEAGKGRTGVAVACYRMVVDKWPAERAIAEAKSFGMAMPGQERFLRKFWIKMSLGEIKF